MKNITKVSLIALVLAGAFSIAPAVLAEVKCLGGINFQVSDTYDNCGNTIWADGLLNRNIATFSRLGFVSEGDAATWAQNLQDASLLFKTCTPAKEIGCANEGQVLAAGQNCCGDLKPINTLAKPDISGDCQEPMGGMMCTAKCGNKIQDAGENKCNCPDDFVITTEPIKILSPTEGAVVWQGQANRVSVKAPARYLSDYDWKFALVFKNTSEAQAKNALLALKAGKNPTLDLNFVAVSRQSNGDFDFALFDKYWTLANNKAQNVLPRHYKLLAYPVLKGGNVPVSENSFDMIALDVASADISDEACQEKSISMLSIPLEFGEMPIRNFSISNFKYTKITVYVKMQEGFNVLLKRWPDGPYQLTDNGRTIVMDATSLGAAYLQTDANRALVYASVPFSGIFTILQQRILQPIPALEAWVDYSYKYNGQEKSGHTDKYQVYFPTNFASCCGNKVFEPEKGENQETCKSDWNIGTCQQQTFDRQFSCPGQIFPQGSSASALVKSCVNSRLVLRLPKGVNFVSSNHKANISSDGRTITIAIGRNLLSGGKDIEKVRYILKTDEGNKVYLNAEEIYMVDAVSASKTYPNFTGVTKDLFIGPTLPCQNQEKKEEKGGDIIINSPSDDVLTIGQTYTIGWSGARFGNNVGSSANYNEQNKIAVRIISNDGETPVMYLAYKSPTANGSGQLVWKAGEYCDFGSNYANIGKVSGLQSDKCLGTLKTLPPGSYMLEVQDRVYNTTGSRKNGWMNIELVGNETGESSEENTEPPAPEEPKPEENKDEVAKINLVLDKTQTKQLPDEQGGLVLVGNVSGAPTNSKYQVQFNIYAAEDNPAEYGIQFATQLLRNGTIKYVPAPEDGLDFLKVLGPEFCVSMSLLDEAGEKILKYSDEKCFP